MPAYLIADIELHDTVRYRDYVEHVPALIEKHGGKYCVRGGRSEVLEGSWVPSRLIVLEFPDRTAALAFYNDPQYEPYKRLRQSVSDGNLVIAEGYGSNEPQNNKARSQR